MVQQLDDILDDMVRSEADRLTFEWVSGGLEVTIYQGPMGVGDVLKGPITSKIMKEIVTRAKLERRSRGTIDATILGRQMKFVVREYNHFGETAFEIRPGAPARRGRTSHP